MHPDPTMLPPDDPCCELIGPPIQIDDDTKMGSEPVIAWNRCRMGCRLAETAGTTSGRHRERAHRGHARITSG